MTIGSWEPPTSDKDAPYQFDREFLRSAIALSRADHLDDMANRLPAAQCQQQKSLMQQSRQTWTAEAENYSDEELLELVRFFTAAEMKLSDWEAGASSPVVWLVKVLRKRGVPPSRELLLWIRENSNNRFLPNGALL